MPVARRVVAAHIVSLLALAAPGFPAQQVAKREPPALFAVRQNNQWGYIDRAGNYVWQPTK
ncbi:MAG: hypothetical protein LC785_10375 [Acidobacteria bacterium]|nr:hypothetical protein [Acidobacteriota bacterium]MCA1642332.1 hypothetical protein [Acidobacteriota bacterium]